MSHASAILWFIVIGSSLGHYRITEKLGAGGMGVVYRARDERLQRDVALKVLPPEALREESARKRFQQEALALSQLNHPHICTIHEIGEDGGQTYIVMEYVAGAVLSKLVPPEGLPVDTLLRYAAQIADALAHAHERGVLHRDLKGGNVMVSPEGRCKVVDFGLAKRRPAAGHVADQPTISEAFTEAGAVVGTVPYMAPEVLRGGEADARSDIWSLGVLLYHTATGRMPFQGTSGADLASAILREPAPPLPPHIPAGLRAIVGRCLSKEPAQRYQQAGEVRAALELVREVSSATTPVPASAGKGWRRMAIAGAALLTLAAVARVWQYFESGRPPQVGGQRVVSTFAGSHKQPSVSPDGNMIVFISDASGVDQVWVKNLAQGEPIQITTGDVPASLPRWSPKSDQIVYTLRGRGIWSIPPLGGPARRVIENGINASFSSDGERLVFERGEEIWIARSDGGDPRKVSGVPELSTSIDRRPVLSPDGGRIAYFQAKFGPNGDIWVIPAAGGQPRQVTNDTRMASAPMWTPDGNWIVYSSARRGSRTLWRVRPSGGDPEPVTTGTGEDHDPAISADGRKLMFTNVRNSWRLTLLDPARGAKKELMERRTGILWPRIAPDGGRIAFFHETEAGVHVYSIGLDGKDLRQITSGEKEMNIMPRWSADGSFLYFYRLTPAAGLRKIPAAGGGSVEVAPWHFHAQSEVREHPQGNVLIYTLLENFQAKATMIRDLTSGQERKLAMPLFMPNWSADGRLVAGHQPGDMVTTCPADGSECTALTKGFQPKWSGDGRMLYFLRRGESPTSPELWSIDLASKSEKKHAVLGPFRVIDLHFDLSPQNQVVYAPFEQGRSELWQADLK